MKIHVFREDISCANLLPNMGHNCQLGDYFLFFFFCRVGGEGSFPTIQPQSGFEPGCTDCKANIGATELKPRVQWLFSGYWRSFRSYRPFLVLFSSWAFCLSINKERPIFHVVSRGFQVPKQNVGLIWLPD